jgi:DNA polymerase III subunit delta'
MLTPKTKLNWPLVGNAHITEFLEKIIIKDEVAGTYIFSGPDNLGKTTAAVYFAQILLCQRRETANLSVCGECSSCQLFNFRQGTKIKDAVADDGEGDNLNFAHGDWHLLKKDKDKKNIAIEQVRDFIHALSMSSFLNSYKIGIIKHADSLSAGAADALLKTLEEPQQKVIIILITSDIDQINPTIVSRSKVLNFYPVPADFIYDYLLTSHNASRSSAKNYSRLSLGRPALAVKFLQDQEFHKHYEQMMRIFLDFFQEDINSRMAALGNLLEAKLSGQEAAAKVKRILDVWQGLARDFLLLEFGQADLIQHWLAEKELQQTKKKISLPRLLNISQQLRRSHELLAANVNPKLVLENIVINL